MGNLAELYKNEPLPIKWEEIKVGDSLKVIGISDEINPGLENANVGDIVKVIATYECDGDICNDCISKGKAIDFKCETGKRKNSMDYSNCYYIFSTLDGRKVVYE